MCWIEENELYNDGGAFKITCRDESGVVVTLIEVKPENYATDKKYPNIVYIPESSYLNINTNNISWNHKGKAQQLKLSPFKTYIHPSGNKLRLEKHKSIDLWRIVETYPEGVFCHKPCTVSGGGKSEISKSMQNAITYARFNVHNIDEDFKKADEIIEFNYSTRWKVKDPNRPKSRSLLSEKRTLGSVVKLLTPSEENSDEFNEWLEHIPVHIRSLVLFVKRLFRQAHGGKLNWKDLMTVDIINGEKGTSLLYNNTPVVGSYVRIGFNLTKKDAIEIYEDTINYDKYTQPVQDETPELFMDFICSLTGKSPSTTGAGSEGALTKAPFNMLTPTTDLNNALLSHILTESNGFSTAAGYIGVDWVIELLKLLLCFV